MSSNIVTNKLLHSAAKTRNFGRFASSSRGSEARLDLNPAADNFAATPELWRAVGLMLKNSDKFRSEERRVGKECRSRWSPYH